MSLSSDFGLFSVTLIFLACSVCCWFFSSDFARLIPYFGQWNRARCFVRLSRLLKVTSHWGHLTRNPSCAAWWWRRITDALVYQCPHTRHLVHCLSLGASSGCAS